MTVNVLRIDGSARTTGSVTRDLTDRIIEKIDAAQPAVVVTRDLSNPLPLLTESWVGANFTAPDERSESQNEELALSDTLVSELTDADIVVIGLPIYNFGVPASVKAWVDLVARAGVTFKYTETGPVGLLEGKRVIVAVASGGTPMGSDWDYATNYVRHVLGFLGIEDVLFVAADGMMTNPEEKLDEAISAIDAIDIAA
ncbi:MAG: NAD(P)H-dependent oxidoreductase [Boseongicola sp.]|nr:NAD(P)H-dependent oxidoreductase [Boseongicola sp.]MDD9979672.1 NAD(P)H-dependent oxidoreductase [Boseongicola sp.]